MACETIWYSNGMQGAPSISGTVSSLIDVLDGCLVDGFAAVALTSLSVTSNVATATISGGHAFRQWSVVEISGASPSGLNGRKRVLSVTGTAFTFATSGIVDQTATGTITAKVPAAGWTEAFAATDRKVYRLDAVAGTGGYLYVDDSSAQSARVRGYMSGMSAAADSGNDPFPTEAQASGGGYCRKSSAASAATRDWIIVADNRFFYIAINTDQAGTYKSYFFGDYVSFASGAGPWDCVFSFGIGSPTASPFPGYVTGSTSNERLYFPRVFAATGSSVQGTKGGIIGRTTSALTTTDAYPHPVSGGIIGHDLVLLFEGTFNANIRGRMPGYVAYLNNCSSALSWNTPHLLDGFDEYILPIFTGDISGPAFGVSLGDWR